MKYLVTWEVPPAPPAMAKTAAALLEATKAWIENEKKAGGIIGIWGDTQGRGGLAIAEYDSNDALYAKLMDVPFSPFAQFSVTPLSDWDLVVGTTIQYYKKIAEAIS
jgi:muconolactone delta-isomerase